MPSLRDIRRRIRSNQNMQKITKAMQVVAATRMRRAQQSVRATRPYAEKMLEVLQTTAERAAEYRHPYLEQRQGDRALFVVVTADRGLCGALNTNTLRAVNRYVNEHHRGQARYVTIGRKGRNFLARYRREIVADASGLKDRPGEAAILPAVRAALDEYDQGRGHTHLLADARDRRTPPEEGGRGRPRPPRRPRTGQGGGPAPGLHLRRRAGEEPEP